MQVSGRLLVLATFAIGLVMAGGAWWYNYSQSLRTAKFWGAEDAKLIVGAEKVELLELAPIQPASEVAAELAEPLVAGRAVTAKFDLSGQRGLIHLRHALTFDANFVWDALDPDAADEADWSRALRFAQGTRELVVLFPADFARLGRMTNGGHVEALPCPHLGAAIIEYLGRVGAPGFAPAN